MKFDSAHPNLSNRGFFYDHVVTPQRCYYYLSFLEKFVELTKDMTFDELRMFMACAEYRYFKFVHRNQSYGYGKMESIDAAFFKQAYLLYLAQDNENGGRLGQYPGYGYSGYPYVNPQHICMQARQLDVTKLRGDNLPLQLTKENFKQACDTSFAEILCLVCFALNKIHWKAFADWRYDHTVAVQCHTCDAMLTAHHFGKANLIHDLTKKNIPFILKDFAEIVQLLSTDDAVQRLPFNSGLEGIRSFLLEKLNQEEHEINGFIDKIGSTYFCSPYPATSVDLMRAVADFYPFAFKVTQTTNWKYRDDYWKCVYQYYHFANMVGNTESPGMAPIPNIRIDLARHLHMLDPASYCRSKIWNHTIDIPKDETKAKQRAESTNCEWNIYLAKHKQSAGVVEMKRRKKKMSWTEGMLKRFQRLGNYRYLDYAMEETSISYKGLWADINRY